MSALEAVQRTAPGPYAYLPGEYRVQLVASAWERRACHALRRDVFCSEQQMFHDSDRDEIDEFALHIAASVCCCGQGDAVVGTVRIHSLEPGLWQGSRLAVARDYRHVAGLGSELIRHAVGIAKGLGAQRFVAQVQAQNTVLFRRLHWRTIEERDVLGHPHHLMVADLSRYAARASGEFAFLASRSRAA
jgi:putative N-acetyltransferase (TIGR04045 family)